MDRYISSTQHSFCGFRFCLAKNISIFRIARSARTLQTVYIARFGAPTLPEELAKHARIHLLHKGDNGEWRLINDGRVFVVDADNSILSANNMTMIRHIARLGAGIAVVDNVMANEDVRNGVLQPILPEWKIEPMPVSILTPGKLFAAKTRVFIEMLANSISDVSGLVPSEPLR